MPTKLDKSITRESTVKHDNREILVTLTDDQKISFKLKGMKSGTISIGIDELYTQLIGEDVPATPTKKKQTVVKKDLKGHDPMISLYDLRTNNLVTKMDFKTKLVLESLICELIKQDIKIFSES